MFEKKIHTKYEVFIYLTVIAGLYSLFLIYGNLFFKITSTITFIWYAYYVIKTDWREIIIGEWKLITTDFNRKKSKHEREDVVFYRPRFRTNNPPLTSFSIRIYSKKNKKILGSIYFFSRKKRLEFISKIKLHGYSYSENFEKY